MTQIPILSGAFSDGNADFRVSYPLNLTPVAQAQGISTGYLRPADGIVTDYEETTPTITARDGSEILTRNGSTITGRTTNNNRGIGPGLDRGGIEWNNILYRVMGTSLVRISAAGVVTTIGTIPGSDRCILVYSFDYLAIAGDGKLFLYDGTTLTQVTDPDLGTVVDVVWVDGYFMTTDGEFLVITELNNPFAVDPLKYGSSEIDPDPVVGLIKLRNEIYAVNRHTIEVFQNVGTTGFPFERIQGAQITRGSVGVNANCAFLDQIAFIGGGMGEGIAVWLGVNGNSVKISTREIDIVLSDYTEAQLALAFMETRTDRDYRQLLIHLPDKCLVYDGAASAVLQQPVWYCYSSSLDGVGRYRSSRLVYAYGRWNTGDTQSAAFGYLVDDVSTHWGQTVGWNFQTQIIYNESRGVVVHDLELVALTGRVALGADPQISTSYSQDGVTYSQQKFIRAGKIGDRSKRLVWMQQGGFRNWRLQRFSGTSDAFLSFARLEARLEPLAW
jgi:hypothetical protein